MSNSIILHDKQIEDYVSIKVNYFRIYVYVIVGNWKIADPQGYWLCEGTLTQVYSNKFFYDTINFPLEDWPLFFLKQKLSIPSKSVVQACRVFKRTFIFCIVLITMSFAEIK